MRVQFVIPLLLVACGDNLQSESTTDGETNQEEDADAETPQLDAYFSFSSPSCDRNVSAVEAVVTYADGTPITNAQCQYTFDDGATLDSCVGEHEFGVPGNHSARLVVTDPATGATTTVDGPIWVYPPMRWDIEFRKPACGLEFTYNVVVENASERHVFIEPPELVLSIDSTNTVKVAQEGTYTIRLIAEDERTTGPICSINFTKEVSVACCPHTM